MGRYWDDDSLFHHGIKGMKWGIQNGPPYPLGSGISTGKKLKTISGGQNYNINIIKGPWTLYGKSLTNKIYRNTIAKRTGPIDKETGLHKKDREYTIHEDSKKVNPARLQGLTNTRVNCAYCVTAYELRRRGYDVIANTSNKPVGSMKLYQTYFKDTKRNIEKNVSEYFNPDAKHMEEVFKPGKEEKGRTALELAMRGENKEHAAHIIKELSSKSNQRGLVTLFWGSGSSHVMNYETKNGKVTFIDSQCGKTYTEKDAEDIFSSAFASTYYRIDNCDLNLKKIKKEAIR